MAHLDDLIAQVQDEALRREMQRALAALKRKQRFGLVYEEHVPETTALLGLPVQPGALVQRRDDADARATYRVRAVTLDGSVASIELVNGVGGGVKQRTYLLVTCS